MVIAMGYVTENGAVRSIKNEQPAPEWKIRNIESSILHPGDAVWVQKEENGEIRFTLI